MEEITISLTINKWILYIVVVALFASFISNMMTLYVYYLKRELAKEESKHENSGLNIPIVSFSLRDKFAMMAMGGLTSATEQDGTWTGNVPEIVSEEAYNIADAMIKARSNNLKIEYNEKFN
jgi:hypothetical protein